MHPKSTHAHPLAWDNKNIFFFNEKKTPSHPSLSHLTQPNLTPKNIIHSVYLWFSLPYMCPKKRSSPKAYIPSLGQSQESLQPIMFCIFLVPSDFQTQPQNEHSVLRERRNTLAMILKTCYYYCSCCTLHQLMIHQNYNILTIVVLVVSFIIKTKTRGVSRCGLAIYIKKYLKAKRRIMKTQIFHNARIWSSKKSSKRNQNPSRYYNSRTNLKFQHKPKYHLSRTLISK
jgi:hypothetical protein